MKTPATSTKRPRVNRAEKKLRFLQDYIDRHGKRRINFRRAGQPVVPLPGLPHSPEFMAAYARLCGEVVERRAPGSSGTIGAAIAAYYQTKEFTGFAASTQKMRRRILEKLRTRIGQDQLKNLSKGHIVSVILGPLPVFESNNWLKTLRGLLAYAVEAELIAADPSAGIKKQKGSGGSIHTWSDEEIAQYRARHALGTTSRLALELMLNTVQRRSDAIKLGPQYIRRGGRSDFGNGYLFIQQKKTKMEQQDRALEIPVLPELQAALEATRSGQLTFLVNQYGRPFTEAGFGMRFHEWCQEAGLPAECSSHGLRKFACCELLKPAALPTRSARGAVIAVSPS